MTGRCSPSHDKILELVHRSRKAISLRHRAINALALLFAFITKATSGQGERAHIFQTPPLKSLADHYPASVSISLILEPESIRCPRASKQPAVSLSPPPLLIFPLSSYFRSRLAETWMLLARTTRVYPSYIQWVHDGFNLIRRELSLRGCDRETRGRAAPRGDSLFRSAFLRGGYLNDTRYDRCALFTDARMYITAAAFEKETRDTWRRYRVRAYCVHFELHDRNSVKLISAHTYLA